MKDDNEKSDTFRDVLALGEELLGVYERNKHILSGVSSGAVGGVDVTNDDVPVDVVSEDSAIKVTVLAGDGDVQQVGFTLDGDELELGFGGKTVTIGVPEDANIDEAEAEMNNGVLTAVIPREGGEE